MEEYTLTPKKVPFKREQIELCHNCQGTGFVENDYNGQVLPVCPICGGSGRVKKTTEGTVTIEPYNDDNRN